MLKEITGYLLSIYGNLGDDNVLNRGHITLVSESRIAGFIKFYDSGLAAPEDFVYEKTGQITMHVPSNMYLSVVDMLRNEKPVFLNFEGRRAVLRTGTEPVGPGDE